MHFSVIIPYYKNSDTLAQTLDSVLRQTTPGSVEILVVDDGSDDGARIGSGTSGHEIAFHRLPHVGMTPNFNRAVSMARCELIHLLNADDYVLPGFYKTVATYADRYPDRAIYATQTVSVDENDRLLWLPTSIAEWAIGPGGRIFTPLHLGNPLYTPAVVIRRSFYQKFGLYDTRLNYACDWEMFARATVKGGGLAIPEALAVYRHGTANQTSMRKRTGENMRDIARVGQITSAYMQVDEPRFREWLTKNTLTQVRAFEKSGDHFAAAANRQVAEELSNWTTRQPLPLAA
jgi:glycosyltransferase involved in cell wall biosynthesis